MNTVAQSWNYLFSNLGHGQQMPICQEEALLAFGFGKKPFYSQGFSPGNGQLILWFEALCKYRKVQGKAGFFWKKVGYNKTKITDNQALEKIKSALKSNNISLVYHCNNHYMLPIGYEESPKNPKLTYKVKTQDLKPEEKNTYIIVADQALLPNSQVFVVPNFENICTDLGTEHPYLYNIKGENLTLKRGDEFYPGGKQYKDNRHCLLAFYKI
ncbi:hypothetical protein PPERSA_07768 [Pseudocohnilembus persalinus]|uniref:Uncharacterized protein n=1 Tax=Pseudocohnilembus persalinus TaxID=266149 RepID=A0A0V0R9U3_PSEPJ|nr:hypothetical protein PPERSA_07768 [Pseudocohnilembus persalinus]|eukprot:KRX11243.1 hypothetical protein PPERSA_07768 [Pseudocohnilembus persalinus]